MISPKLNRVLLLSFCFILLVQLSFANAKQGLDDKAQKLLNKIYVFNESEKLLVLVVSSNDCFKCSVSFNAILKDERFGKVDKLIISDEFVIVKQLTEGLDNAPKFIIEPTLLEHLSPSGKSMLLVKVGNQLNLEDVSSVSTEALGRLLASNNDKCSDSLVFVDSIFSSGHIQRAIFDDSYLLFDAKSQFWATVVNGAMNYSKPVPLDSHYVYSLPMRVDTNRFALLKSYKQMLDYSKDHKIPLLRVEGLSFNDSLVCVSFILNRVFVDRTSPNGFAIFSTYFLAVKKISTKESILQATNLNSFEKIFFADFVTNKAKIFPIRIYSPILLHSDRNLYVKVNEADDLTQTTKFYGAALLKLDFETSKLLALEVLPQSSAADTLDDVTMYKDCGINIHKVMEDRNTNMGKIFINSFKGKREGE